MDEKGIYTKSDCMEIGSFCSIKGKATVLNREALSPKDQNQLYFCLCGNGTVANPNGCAVCLVSLRTGAFSLKRRSEILGVLKPELLPDSARQQLSQIRPVRALDLGNHEPKYSGNCVLPNGTHTADVRLYSDQEARDYVEMQKPYQHCVMIRDQRDLCVLKMVEGRLFHPSPQNPNCSP